MFSVQGFFLACTHFRMSNGSGEEQQRGAAERSGGASVHPHQSPLSAVASQLSVSSTAPPNPNRPSLFAGTPPACPTSSLRLPPCVLVFVQLCCQESGQRCRCGAPAVSHRSSTWRAGNTVLQSCREVTVDTKSTGAFVDPSHVETKFCVGEQSNNIDIPMFVDNYYNTPTQLRMIDIRCPAPPDSMASGLIASRSALFCIAASHPPVTRSC